MRLITESRCVPFANSNSKRIFASRSAPVIVSHDTTLTRCSTSAVATSASQLRSVERHYFDPGRESVVETAPHHPNRLRSFAVACSSFSDPAFAQSTRWTLTPATTGDESSDFVPGHRGTALGETNEHVVKPFNMDADLLSMSDAFLAARPVDGGRELDVVFHRSESHVLPAAQRCAPETWCSPIAASSASRST